MGIPKGDFKTFEGELLSGQVKESSNKILICFCSRELFSENVFHENFERALNSLHAGKDYTASSSPRYNFWTDRP